MTAHPIALRPPRYHRARAGGPDRAHVRKLAARRARTPARRRRRRRRRVARAATTRCTACDLSRHATQTVFGRGPADACVVMVGEQPGDQEDLKGAPFVGPAGEVFDRALAEVGLPRERLYVTNAVKHFKFTPRGKRRIHATPGPADIAACRPWIEAELELLHPEVLVCLGATAARALIGPAFRLMQQRGIFLETRWAARTVATFH